MLTLYNAGQAPIVSLSLSSEHDVGRLGHGDDAYRRLPTMVEGLKGKKVVQATCFGAHNAVLTDVGQVFMWGSGTVRHSPSLATSLEGSGTLLTHGDATNRTASWARATTRATLRPYSFGRWRTRASRAFSADTTLPPQSMSKDTSSPVLYP